MEVLKPPPSAVLIFLSGRAPLPLLPFAELSKAGPAFQQRLSPLSPRLRVISWHFDLLLFTSSFFFLCSLNYFFSYHLPVSDMAPYPHPSSRSFPVGPAYLVLNSPPDFSATHSSCDEMIFLVIASSLIVARWRKGILRLRYSAPDLERHLSLSDPPLSASAPPTPFLLRGRTWITVGPRPPRRVPLVFFLYVIVFSVLARAILPPPMSCFFSGFPFSAPMLYFTFGVYGISFTEVGLCLTVPPYRLKASVIASRPFCHPHSCPLFR